LLEVHPVGQAARRRALEARRLLHPRAADVSAALFRQGLPFFFAADKVQVKYEMLRAHLLEGTNVRTAALMHGYSRGAFYLVAAAFEEKGMLGLLDERRGRRGPLKVTSEVAAFVHQADPSVSGAELAVEIEKRFGVHLHRRTVERARQR
jgi:transposase